MGDHKHKKERKSSKREHSSSTSSSSRDHKKHKKSSSSSRQKHEKELEIDYSDPSLWVEAAGANDSGIQSEIAPADYLKSQQQANEAKLQLQDDVPTSSMMPKEQDARHGWMLDGGLDFGAMGSARIREEDKPKVNPDLPKVSERELNQHLVQGVKFEDYPEEQKRAIKFGDAGSNWRMMKLKRAKEQAQDQGRSLREVGIEKYGSVEKFEEALAEREYLDNRRGGSSSNSSRQSDDRRSRDRNYDGRYNDNRRSRDSNSDRGRRYMFTDTDSQQKSFKRPSPPPPRYQTQPASTAATPSVPAPLPPTPVPVIPQISMPVPIQALTRDQLNKLNSKIVKAKLMGSDNVEALEKEYQLELEKFEQAENTVQVLPQLDSQGRLYDYALKQGNPEHEVLKGKKKYEGTHDKITGERLRYGTSDDTLSLAEMVRQEKGGNSRSSNMDMEFANRIMADAAFENNLDYMDDKADIMASKKGATEEQKMRRAVTDYKRTQETLSRCKFCYQNGNPPQLAMISLGTTCYLALPNVQELTPGNCLIVPIQHVSSTLECDDDVWTEIRNFQKCLMKMFHEQGKGVVFMETVINLRQQRHAVIEAVPIPYGVYEDAPAYFKEAIMASGEEWSQHKKIIDTSVRGFRHSMVPNLPYFHVWCGLDKGYGHVIENTKDFPYWFGKEVIAGMMDLGPELWRKPRYHHASENHARQQAFNKSWDKWDWTKALE
ncbi:complexed with cdc5 protein cwf19 [Mucor ambiguus]|uniref:Complexed with cdc5 protein cwf19 n=1 Tax=Mucor ambiguus TaxID=91626 RepID=A0A0C9LR65_9FUNG|nr:complexed with cdc5 protein cwf19 [Mucor ambiguus]